MGGDPLHGGSAQPAPWTCFLFDRAPLSQCPGPPNKQHVAHNPCLPCSVRICDLDFARSLDQEAPLFKAYPLMQCSIMLCSMILCSNITLCRAGWICSQCALLMLCLVYSSSISSSILWSAMHALFDPDDHNACNSVLSMHCTESNGEISRKNDLPRAFSFTRQTDLFFSSAFSMADPLP